MTDRRDPIHELTYQFLEYDIQAVRSRISLMEKRIMATLAEVVAALAAAKTTAEEERAEVVSALATLTAEITALKEQIAAGGAVTEADLDAVVAQITEVTATIEAIQA